MRSEIVKLSASSRRWHDLYKVSSSTRRGVYYVIGKTLAGEWGCSCPQWIFHTPRQDCKHIRAVKDNLLKLTAPIQVEPIEKGSTVEKILSRFSLIEI